MSVIVTFLDGSDWQATNSFFRNIVETYRHVVPDELLMKHEMDMIAAVGGVFLQEREPRFVVSFLDALGKVSRHMIDDLLQAEKLYPEDLAIQQELSACR